jgi:hypothetical protein
MKANADAFIYAAPPSINHSYAFSGRQSWKKWVPGVVLMYDTLLSVADTTPSAGCGSALRRHSFPADTMTHPGEQGN